jgi:hypothetical protein
LLLLSVVMRRPSELVPAHAEAPRFTPWVRSARKSWVKPAADCAFLAAAVIVSLVVYVWNLGFYADDYASLWSMNASHDQSLSGLYDAVRPGTGQRPLQAGTFAVLYRLFGLHPLGYHLFNAGLLVTIAVLLYLVLRELRLPRAVCVAVPLVYSMLPHYATERFWLNAFEISLSTAFYLLSLYAGLRAVRSSGRMLWGWLAIAVVGIAGSLLSYELALPLFVLNLTLIWWAGRQPDKAESTPARLWPTLAVISSGLLAVGALKTAAVVTHGQNGYEVGVGGGGAAHHYAYLVWGGLKVNFGTYLAAFPYVLWWILSHRFSVTNAGVALAVGILAFAYVWRIGRADSRAHVVSDLWRRLVGGGLVVFVLGYATFLATSTFLFRSAGIDNRINAAAALGLATAFVGGLGWLAHRLDERHAAVAFAGGVACIAAAGTLVIQTLGTYWTEAPERQRAVMDAILGDSRSVPRGGTFILDGACPEVGPTPVFTGRSDLGSALKLQLHNRAPIHADVASFGLRVARGRLELTARYADHSTTRTYPLNANLVVYDFVRRRLVRLSSAESARHYVAHRSAFSCSPLRSFAWGFDPGRRWSPA